MSVKPSRSGKDLFVRFAAAVLRAAASVTAAACLLQLISRVTGQPISGRTLCRLSFFVVFAGYALAGLRRRFPPYNGGDGPEDPS